jgi:hypothetical protein
MSDVQCICNTSEYHPKRERVQSLDLRLRSYLQAFVNRHPGSRRLVFAKTTFSRSSQNFLVREYKCIYSTCIVIY